MGTDGEIFENLIALGSHAVFMRGNEAKIDVAPGQHFIEHGRMLLDHQPGRVMLPFLPYFVNRRGVDKIHHADSGPEAAAAALSHNQTLGIAQPLFSAGWAGR